MSTGESPAPDLDPSGAIEIWRERGAARLDPVGLRVVEGLARRAAMQQGEARQRLSRRIEELIASSATPKPTGNAAPSNERDARRAVLSDLSALTARLGRTPTSQPPAPKPSGRAEPNPHAAATAPLMSSSGAPAPSGAVNALKSTWTRLRVEQRMRQAMAQVPAMAGPLNSSHLINRTLQTMRELSPEYLDAFMLHVDALLWMEHASGASGSTASAPASKDARRPGPRAVRKS